MWDVDVGVERWCLRTKRATWKSHHGCFVFGRSLRTSSSRPCTLFEGGATVTLLPVGRELSGHRVRRHRRECFTFVRESKLALDWPASLRCNFAAGESSWLKLKSQTCTVCSERRLNNRTDVLGSPTPSQERNTLGGFEFQSAIKDTPRKPITPPPRPGIPHMCTFSGMHLHPAG